MDLQVLEVQILGQGPGECLEPEDLEDLFQQKDLGGLEVILVLEEHREEEKQKVG